MTPHAELADTYSQVVADLARSDFARRRQLSVQPMSCHLAELAAIRRRLPAGGRVLDIGTGMGIVPETLMRLGHQVVTVDVATNAGQREPLERLRALGAEAHFAMVGQERIPIADSSIDVAFAGDVIEHLPGTPKWFLAEIRRVLKPGGWTILTTPNAVRLPVRLRVALGYSNWPPVAQYINNAAAPPFHLGHHHEYTAAELRFVLAHAGFDAVDIAHFEDTLRRPGIVRGLRDIQTQDRLFAQYWQGRAARLHPGELVRLALLGLVKLFPHLRSLLIASARKPLTS